MYVEVMKSKDHWMRILSLVFFQIKELEKKEVGKNKWSIMDLISRKKQRKNTECKV